jgi:chromosome segregation ATPase
LYEIAKRDYTTSKNEVNSLGALTEKLRESVEDRKGKYATFQKMICSNTRINFTARMHERQYSGKLHFDHVMKTLDLLVEKFGARKGDGEDEEMREEDEDEDAVGPDMKSLSGGEKSFSTICLLLALWDHMQVPFRALDEFGTVFRSDDRCVYGCCESQSVYGIDDQVLPG